MRKTKKKYESTEQKDKRRKDKGREGEKKVVHNLWNTVGQG